jgi:hypothetical protein
LQDALPKFDEAGIKLYAVSYDDRDALRAFAESRGIRFPLLSDPDSAIMRSFGLLNSFLTPDEVPFYGVAIPGTYVLNERGVVVEKFFPRNIAKRESAETTIDSVLGRVLRHDDTPGTRGGNEDVRITAFIQGGGGTLKNGLLRRLIVRFELREGLHLYGEPVPEGMVALQLELTGPEGVTFEEPIIPPTDTLHHEAMDVDLEVWSGTVDIAVPLFVNSKLAPLVSPLTQDSVTLEVAVRFQACDDTTCLIPRTERLRITAPLEVIDVPTFFGDGSQNITSMDSKKHMQQLVARSKQMKRD